jgi:hypothetical protein
VNFHLNRNLLKYTFRRSELKLHSSNNSLKSVNPEEPRTAGIIGRFMMKYICV